MSYLNNHLWLLSVGLLYTVNLFCVKPIYNVSFQITYKNLKLSLYKSVNKHEMPDSPKIGVLLTNLGTPDAPTKAAVRPFLKELLSDPRVVGTPPPRWLWMLTQSRS